MAVCGRAKSTRRGGSLRECTPGGRGSEIAGVVPRPGRAAGSSTVLPDRGAPPVADRPGSSHGQRSPLPAAPRPAASTCSRWPACSRPACCAGCWCWWPGRWRPVRRWRTPGPPRHPAGAGRSTHGARGAGRFAAPAGPFAPGHRGVDLAAAPGAPVRAAGDGVVAFAGRVAGRAVVSVDHPGGLRTTYEPVVAAVSRAATRCSPVQVLGRLGARGQPLPAGELPALGGSGGATTYLDPLSLLATVRVRLLPVWGSAAGSPQGRRRPGRRPGRRRRPVHRWPAPEAPRCRLRHPGAGPGQLAARRAGCERHRRPWSLARRWSVALFWPLPRSGAAGLAHRPGAAGRVRAGREGPRRGGA